MFIKLLETSGVTLMADSQYSAQTRVQVLLEFLQEKELDLEDVAEIKRIKLEQCLQLCQLAHDGNQVSMTNHICVTTVISFSKCSFLNKI